MLSSKKTQSHFNGSGNNHNFKLYPFEVPEGKKKKRYGTYPSLSTTLCIEYNFFHHWLLLLELIHNYIHIYYKEWTWRKQRTGSLHINLKIWTVLFIFVIQYEQKNVKHFSRKAADFPPPGWTVEVFAFCGQMSADDLKKQKKGLKATAGKRLGRKIKRNNGRKNRHIIIKNK